jgi:hypothetical protein
MVDGAGVSPAGGALPLADAYRTARELLDAAQREADRLLAEADQEARRRQQEADLLVAKARRLLVAAEEKAAVIVAVARRDEPFVIDLDAEVAGLGRVVAPGASRLGGGRVPTRIDGMLASAIGHAVDEAFPLDATT